MTPAPGTRVHVVNAMPVRQDGRHVLYWMTAQRRLRSNFALQHAVALSTELARPLVIFEPLAVDGRWASDRLHRFVLDGMADHARAMRTGHAEYLPFVERLPGEARQLFDSLGRDAAAVITDDHPAPVVQDEVARAGMSLDTILIAVDSNGLLPLRLSDRPFSTALSFRAYVQRTLPGHLADWPADIDWPRLPRAAQPWRPPEGVPPPTSRADLQNATRLLTMLPIDHAVGPVAIEGGERAAAATLRRFVTTRLARYDEDRNHPDLDATSGLSPYLHFGHISTHDIFSAVMTAEGWTSRRLGKPAGGKREGWWGLTPSAEGFLDQLVTWRELGFHSAAIDGTRHTTFAGVPGWAQLTLRAHAADPRPWRYPVEQLEQAQTHDDVWNAAQRQLLREGWMHNYLRMLWAKKILEWSDTPELALDTMIELMNRHAIDGRDPNSYTGYLWALGRYDRPWAPARPIYGTVRYMSSENTKRKLKIKAYLARYGPSTAAC